MTRKDFWKSDWFLGVAVAVVVLAVSGSGLVQSLERKAYDLGVRASDRTPSERIAIIAIDDASIANIGRWPWPRHVHAKLIDNLTAAQAKVIGSTVFFSEPQVDPGLPYVAKLRELYGTLSAEGQESLHEFGLVLSEAEATLSTDRRLASSLRVSGNVVLPVLFRLGEPMGRPDRDMPEFVASNAVQHVGTGALPLPASSLDLSIVEEIGHNAAAVGHLNSPPDVDGVIRSEPLVLTYFDQFYPALSLQIAARSLNLPVSDIRVVLGKRVRLGSLNVQADPNLQMHTYFYQDRDGRPAFTVDSFFDVYSGKIPLEKYRDKIVLIGTTAAGVGPMFVTPVSPSMPSVMIQAHSVSSILQEHFFVVPTWASAGSLGAFLLVALYLVLALPRLAAGMAAAATLAILVALLGAHFALMATQLTWIPLMSAVVLLVLGHLTLTTKRFLVTERGKARSDSESAESNRMLALAFQGQGQLDMAFDKFKKCPLEPQLLDNLYTLGLDFERERQFNKAQTVFEHMATYDRKFRDLEQCIARAKAMSETVILGGGGGARTTASTLMLGTGAVEKPMLGRYQVEKELGKGAMGVVYLGRDPKIGRVVAIKTLALSQEFETDELQEVKARFFREAETAGRLNHPHIVTIFDAGEEHDLAYIAMEFLKGKDLTGHTKPGALLPLPAVMSIISRVAEALDFAHRQNVVHRDIKPANIMYAPESDAVKVTDFGIARITDSSRTKTGMVLGTPSFMSPEQLSGCKVDGQSDLFSLGVTLYQLSCGGLPFQGDSMAQLMYRIANEPPADPLALNPALPECLIEIIERALAKNKEDRFRTGDEMARGLRECGAAYGAVDVRL
jgi:serine/threonine-protein kinase